MKIYIAGPMRGIPGRNYPLLDEVEKVVVAEGHTPSNPANRARTKYLINSDEDLTKSAVQFMLQDDLHDLLACAFKAEELKEAGIPVQG